MDSFEFASPFELVGKRLNHSVSDIEAFIGWWCSERTIKIRKNNRDSTGKWFHLYFDRIKGLDVSSYIGGMTFIEDMNGAQITDMWIEDTYPPDMTDWEKRLRDIEIGEDFRCLKELSSAVLERFEKTAEDIKIRTPKPGSKKFNDWKSVWRNVKGLWKGGGATYQGLAQKARVSPETIADIVKAGDAGLLD